MNHKAPFRGVFLYPPLYKNLLLPLFFSGCLAAGAQRTISKSVALPGGQLLRIHAAQCYLVEIETVKRGPLLIEATMEGEYESELLLQVNSVGGATVVEAGTQALFNLPDDKLGAHKVVSVALRIHLPQDRRVQLFADAARITARGRYKRLQVYLGEGRCSLLGVSQWAEVVTRRADIYLESPAADISASSKYGTVTRHDIPLGDACFRLRTISGNIHLLRRE